MTALAAAASYGTATTVARPGPDVVLPVPVVRATQLVMMITAQTRDHLSCRIPQRCQPACRHYHSIEVVILMLLNGVPLAQSRRGMGGWRRRAPCQRQLILALH
jgi:hypothetical protein